MTTSNPYLEQALRAYAEGDFAAVHRIADAARSHHFDSEQIAEIVMRAHLDGRPSRAAASADTDTDTDAFEAMKKRLSGKGRTHN